MGSTNSTLTAPQISEQVSKRGIPPVIRVQLKKSWKHITCYLSEPDSDPTYCVNLPRGWWGALTLHDGPDETGPPLAHAVGKGRLQCDFEVILPPPTEGDVESGREILRYKLGKSERLWFAMDVGEGAERRLERFEWRRSHGKEVKSIGQGSWGWKLVRLGSGNNAEDVESADDNKTPDVGGLTSDGKEVVAVWADAKAFKSMSKVGELQFRRSGATGELGTRWALMAVISCMCLWQQMMQNATAAAAA